MPRPARFLWSWLAALLVMLALVAAFNCIVNPYEVFAWQRIPGVNDRKPVTKTHVALSKAWQIERLRPITVVLGTSRAYVAVDAGSPLWPEADRPVYNYGTPKSSMSDVIFRELRHAWGTGRLRHAVAILDLPTFLEPDPPLTRGPNERRLFFLDDGGLNPERNLQRLNDRFLSVFTLGALVDSARTVLSWGGGEAVQDLRPDGTATAADFVDAARAEGINALFTDKDEDDLTRIPDFQHVLANWRGPMPNIAILREMVEFCLQRDVELTLILGSSHVDQLELYRRAGLWPYVEQLKVDLARLVANAHGNSVTAWDFVEYSPYTTEPVPPPGDKVTRTRWFWEPVHFTRALADVMLQRVFHGTPSDFGALLTVDTVDSRNQFVREQQRGFIHWRLACEATPRATCRVRPRASSVALAVDIDR